MTQYWCPWCGETAEADGPDKTIPCMRCAQECLALFGFWPRCGMVPLADGERPGRAAASRKRFSVSDVRTGRLLGVTQPAA